MSSEFLVYLQLGFRHIADLAGYDHILFVAALAIPYTLRAWRQLAILVTAFTIGHSVTLALATLRLVSVPSALVETLIPVTIIVTALLALVEQHRTTRSGAMSESLSHSASNAALPTARYALAAGFGLIHGLGFSTFLRALLGAEENIALPLFAFNVGLELGQLLILALVLAVGGLAVRLVLPRARWVQLLAGITGGLATVLLVQRLAGAS